MGIHADAAFQQATRQLVAVILGRRDAISQGIFKFAFGGEAVGSHAEIIALKIHRRETFPDGAITDN